MLHGRGARKTFKPIVTRTIGADGVVKKTYTKKAVYKCDVGVNGAKLIQPRLPFVKTTSTLKTTVSFDPGSDDTIGAGTSKAGQSHSTGSEVSECDEKCTDRQV